MADDDDRDDEDEDDSRSNRGRQGNRGQRNGNRGKQGNEPDVSGDPQFGQMVIREFFEDLSSDYSEKVFGLPFVRAIFGPLFSTNFGGVFSSYALAPVIQAWAETSPVLGNVLRRLGAPDLMVSGSSMVLGGFIEGARRKLRETGRLTRRDVYEAKSAALKDFRGKLAETVTYVQALQALTVTEQITFDEKIRALGEDRAAVFEKFKGKISSPKDLRVLFELPIDRWIPHLEQKYGKADVKTGIASLFDKVERFASTAIDKLTGPMSDAERAEIAAKEARLRAKVTEVQDRRAARRQRRGW